MNFSLFKLLLTSFAFGSYMWLWYQGEMIPAWHAAVWAFVAFLDDLYEYLFSKDLK
jgi:hypothetical protein